MGLAAPKNRIKISSDPQNTAWANNTSRFGHKILEKQGWKPGSTLGAKDAAHKEHYSVASSSHIRVFLKDDTLGLGAKRGSERAENFGLAGLESILGRLNGRIEEVKKEEERRVEVERKGYIAQRYGYMNFISGGFLVGDKIEKKLVKEEVKEEEVKIKIEPKDESSSEEDKEKSKKRKRSRDEEVEVKKEDGEEQPSLKRKKKSMDLREEAQKQKKDKKDKKDKKAKKDKKSKKSESGSTESPADAASEELSDKAKRKAEKKARKEEKKLKKALKKAARKAKEGEPDSSSSEEETGTTGSTSVPTTGTSTPVFGGGARGHHFARAKHIRAKKMASMDPQALKEIFMIKTPA